MKDIDFWLSIIFATVISVFAGTIFDWGIFKFVLCLFVSWIGFALYLVVDSLATEQREQIAIEEAENRELINKALKHYAETKGIK
jgi:hypothetical protein